MRIDYFFFLNPIINFWPEPGLAPGRGRGRARARARAGLGPGPGQAGPGARPQYTIFITGILRDKGEF